MAAGSPAHHLDMDKDEIMPPLSLHNLLLCYLTVGGLFFLVGLTIGKILKKDILHGRVMLGFFNSALLALVWPIMVVLILIGWAYDVVQAWKKL